MNSIQDGYKYFCIIGAQRSGTTFLTQTLDKHPDICFAKPLRPEPKFFINDEDFLKGKEFYLEKYFNCKPNRSNYLAEKSTSYLENKCVSKRILSFFPDAKVIVSLRNPVDRALSNYFFSFNNGIEKRTVAEVFLEKKTIPSNSDYNTSVSPFNYVERGRYHKFLRPYLNDFGENLKVLLFEEMISDESVLNELCDFLEIDKFKHQVNTNLKINFSKRSESKVQVLADVRDVLKKYYRDDIIKLESLLDRKVEIWTS